MLYGEEKLLEMSRSILPSKSRKNSRRRKAWANRWYRRSWRYSLHRVEVGLDYDFEDTHRKEHKARIHALVTDRRDADKLRHFVRWAKTRADALGADPSSRMSKMRAILPAGLIGWHACTHLEFHREFEVNVETRVFFEPYAKPDPLHLLKGFSEDPDFVVALNRVLRARVVPRVWILGYRKVREGEVLRFIPVTEDVTVYPPILVVGDPHTFWRAVRRARLGRPVTPIPAESTRDLLFPGLKGANPHHNPEWFWLLCLFLEHWSRGNR